VKEKSDKFLQERKQVTGMLPGGITAFTLLLTDSSALPLNGLLDEMEGKHKFQFLLTPQAPVRIYCMPLGNEN
jgi:hypothetical protein